MESRNLLLTHDSFGDSAHIYLRHPIGRGDVVRSDITEVQSADRTRIVLGFDEYDHLVSIDVLGASKVLPPELLQ
jgi:Protein of unknown function (DUF2283)